jgi:hypothetical protein
VQPLGQHDLERGGDRDGHQGAYQAQDRPADQGRQQHRGRAHADGMPQNARCNDVVLELLVGHEEDGHDHRGRP